MVSFMLILNFLVYPPAISITHVTSIPPRSSIPLSIDLDLDRDRTLLRLQHNQIVVVGNILHGSFEQASARNDAQSNECSHDVDFAVRKTVIDYCQHEVN